jgi:hypothetical protein
MQFLVALYKKWFGVRNRQIADILDDAQHKLKVVLASGTIVSDSILQPILAARDAHRAGSLASATERAFYEAYAKLSELAGKLPPGTRNGYEDPFPDAVNDAEEMLAYAAESGTEVSFDLAKPILDARSALSSGVPGEEVRAAFYDAYSKISKMFGDVTAETVRNCSSPETHRLLRRSKTAALTITAIIASASVITFVADSMGKKIIEDIPLANTAAAKLRAGLSTPDGKITVGGKYAAGDPCTMLDDKPEQGETQVRNLSDIEDLQQFASTIRDLRSKAVKLNAFVFKWECDPLGLCTGPDSEGHNAAIKVPDFVENQLQLKPSITNYTAEVLCKIRAYQQVRTFASNVQSDYAAIIGAFASYALPIAYAMLGALAFQLRLFGDTIRKRSYHPSFADSARTITAVIAGAIAGLFNPAQGTALSPLAIAFLVGYGVELFFKFLDTILNSFGSTVPSRSDAMRAPPEPARTAPDPARTPSRANPNPSPTS